MNEKVTTRQRTSRDERSRFLVRCLAFALFLILILAALCFPTIQWCDIVTTITVVVLFTAILRVVYERGRSRALWLGFALFGWGSFVLLSISGKNLFVHYPPHAISYLTLRITASLVVPRVSSSFVYLCQIVSCFFVWTMAALGALVGWWVYRDDKPRG